MSKQNYPVNSIAQIPEVLKIKTSHYFIGGLSLVTALAWNDAFKQLIARKIPDAESVQAAFLYAIVMIIILVLVIYALPDTTKELPHTAQAKLSEAEIQDIIRTEINKAGQKNGNGGNDSNGTTGTIIERLRKR